MLLHCITIFFTLNHYILCLFLLTQTYFEEEKKWDFDNYVNEVPSCSEETKGYHHFPPIDVEAAKTIVWLNQ